MYDYNQLQNLLSQLLPKVERQRTDFLEKQRSAWAKRVVSNFREKAIAQDSEANKRLSLWRDICRELEKCCRRDAYLPRDIFQELEESFSWIDQSRLAAGKKPNGILLRAKARLYSLVGEYNEAERLLIESVECYGSDTMQVRDRVLTIADRVRVAYMLAKDEEASELATEAIKLARTLDSHEEEKAFKDAAGNPIDFCSALVYSVIAACDALLHRENWESEPTKKEFLGQWDRALELGVPKVLLPDVKIGLISDDLWCKRVAHHVNSIARDLFLQTSPSSAIFYWRSVCCTVSGFELNLEDRTGPPREGRPLKLGRATLAAVLIAAALLAAIPANATVDRLWDQQSLAAVANQAPGLEIDAVELEQSYRKYFSEPTILTVEDLQNYIDPREVSIAGSDIRELAGGDPGSESLSNAQILKPVGTKELKPNRQSGVLASGVAPIRSAIEGLSISGSDVRDL